jgi:hypothetical protein
LGGRVAPQRCAGAMATDIFSTDFPGFANCRWGGAGRRCASAGHLPRSKTSGAPEAKFAVIAKGVAYLDEHRASRPKKSISWHK